MASGSRGKGNVISEEVEEQFFGDFEEQDEYEEQEPNVFPTQESMPNTEDSSVMGDARGGTSNIWEHFIKIARPDRGPNRYDVKCKHCEIQPYKWIGGQGYGTFSRHLQRKHADVLGNDLRQKKISGYGTNSPAFQFDKNSYREGFARLVSVEHLPFNFAESFATINFLQTEVNPQATSISRSTLTRDLKKIYYNDKKQLIEFFMNYNGSVHIGSDIWSDHWQTHSYMGVTCHWIDDEWNIQKRVLAFRVFDTKHAAINICSLLKQILEEYHLVNKIFSIGFDNASANTASIPELEKICKPSFGGQFFHQRCACHVLNLCVQDGLKTLHEYIDPIKNAVQFLWRNPRKMKEWHNFCKINQQRPKRFPKDIPTRWNSCYKLLVETYAHKDLLSSFIHQYLPELNLWSAKWDICAKILDILKYFNDATNTLSGVYFPTTHLFIIEALNIVGMFENIDPIPNVTLDSINVTLIEMRNKWINYYAEIPIIYLVASVLDPRCKLDGLGDYLHAYYKYLNLSTDIAFRQNEVKDVITELYKQFATKFRVGGDDTSHSQSSSSHMESRRGKGSQLLSIRTKKHKGGRDTISEIESYLGNSFHYSDENVEFNILEWWKNHENQYPILSIIAKQVLATPCSTVAVEQLFSSGGNILDVRRSRLTPQNLEKQVCVEDWTKARFRQQELDQTNDEFFDDGATTTTNNTEMDSDD